MTLDALRKKARASFWGVIRGAYREVSCNPNFEDTRSWLSRSLCLESILSEDLTLEPEAWLDEESTVGHTRRKEGVEGKWIICKVR
jgi:hypothetical protein